MQRRCDIGIAGILQEGHNATIRVLEQSDQVTHEWKGENVLKSPRKHVGIIC
jgi:hypothetical protein